MKHKLNMSGYSLAELVIVLAITSLLLLFIGDSFRRTNQVEVFSGRVKEFEAFIRESQAKSFATERPDLDSQTAGQSARGSVMSVNVASNSASQGLLYGTSLERNNSDQREGIIGVQHRSNFEFNKGNMKLSLVTYDPTGNMQGMQPSEIIIQREGISVGSSYPAIASLSPNGQNYILDTHPASAFSSDYESGSIKFYFCEDRPGENTLSARVTFNSISGMIETEISSDAATC